MVGRWRSGTDPAHPFLGRAEVWKEIDGLLAETAAGIGRGLLVTGPGGVGKSELLRAVRAHAEERGFRVGTGRALPEESPAPFSLVRDLLGSLSDEPGRSPDGHLPAAVDLPPLFFPAGGTPPAGPRASPAPRETGRTSDELERILAPLGLTTIEGLGASRARHYVRLVEHVLSLTHDGPVLLAVDDLPFADRSSLEFLLRLADELPGAPLAVVATMGEAADVPEAVRDLLGAIGQAPAFRSIPLRPFTVSELTEFVTWLQQGTPPSPDDVERWYAQTDGNPLFVEQLVRSVLGGGPRDPSATDRAPDLVTVLLARTRSLHDTERRVLTYGAVLGREFDFARLAIVVGVEEERLTEALDRLVLAGLLREKGDEVYEFVSEAVRANVYAELTETRRRILHRRVGAALEARGETSTFDLARQFYLGRDYPKTVEYSLRAAQTATQSFAFDTAIAHLARALEAERHRPDRDPRREVRLLIEYGRLLHETGSLVRSEEVLAQAVEFARAGGTYEIELGRALLALSWTRFDRGLYPEAEALAREAVTILERVGTPRDLLSGHRVLGNVYWRIADLPRAEAHQRTALEIAEREGSPIERGHALVDVANTLVPRGQDRFEAALALYSEAVTLFASGGDPNAQARALMNRGVLEYGAGRKAEAFRDLDAALAAAERSRSPLWIGYCLLNIAQWKAENGDAAAGQAALDRAAEAFRPLANRLATQQIAMTRGMIAQAAGALDEAETHYRESLDQAREIRLAAETPEVLFRLGELSLRRGDRVAARHWLDEALASGLVDHRPDLAPRADALGEEIRAAG